MRDSQWEPQPALSRPEKRAHPSAQPCPPSTEPQVLLQALAEYSLLLYRRGPSRPASDIVLQSEVKGLLGAHSRRFSLTEMHLRSPDCASAEGFSIEEAH